MNENHPDYGSVSINELNNEDAIDLIGEFIDSCADSDYAQGADKALELLEELEKRTLQVKDEATIEYFRANAWDIKAKAAGVRNSWSWEHKEQEKQILALSKAAYHKGFNELNKIRQCQILTNRGNLINTFGRYIDALEAWDAALKIIPNFAMALANRGYCLRHYAGLLSNTRERAIFLLHGYDSLVAASAKGALFDSLSPNLSEEFIQEAKKYEAVADLNRIRELQDVDLPSLGIGKEEQKYRQWCLNNRLFLSPLNDLGSHPRGAIDDLELPPIVQKMSDGFDDGRPPQIFGFFNQIKQEYISARFMLYEGISNTNTHFSDRGVLILDTLEYACHSLANERVRTAFRIAYSLLDKIAYFINHYWKLDKNLNRINFRNVWMIEGKNEVIKKFQNYGNWSLRGLFWLSKELFDDDLKNTTNPDGYDLYKIRNALEHKYLQVHHGWIWPAISGQLNTDEFEYSISSDLLEKKALRVIKMARAALITLSLAIGEQEKTENETNELIWPMPLYEYKYSSKKRDPS